MRVYLSAVFDRSFLDNVLQEYENLSELLRREGYEVSSTWHAPGSRFLSTLTRPYNFELIRSELALYDHALATSTTLLCIGYPLAGPAYLDGIAELRLATCLGLPAAYVDATGRGNYPPNAFREGVERFDALANVLPWLRKQARSSER